MKYRKLGRTDVDISCIVLGCWAIGGGFTWGEQDEKASIDTVRAAVDLGINVFDTAEFYSDGYSEEVVGRGLAGLRQDVLIATKAWADNLTADKIVQACEGSLRRLKTDYIDLYQIHWPNREVPLEETLEAMEKLRQSGKIRYIGVSNFGVDDLAAACNCADVVTNQMAYSLLFRAIEFEIMSACRQADVGVLAYSSLAQGLLTGKFRTLDEVDDERARIRLYSKDRPETVHAETGCEAEVVQTLAAIRTICDDIGESMTRVALAWTLQQPGISGVLVGARDPGQIRDNVQSVDLELPGEVLARLDQATRSVKQYIGANADPWRSASRIR